MSDPAPRLVCPWCTGRAEILTVHLVCETPECRRYDAAFAAREAERRLREGLRLWSPAP